MVNLCEKYDATVLQQLYKIVTGDNGELTTKKAFPVSLIQSTFDSGTGTRLDQVLAMNNCIWLPFKGNRADTRLQINNDTRRKGLIVCFKNIDGEILSQRFKSDDLTDSSWKTDSNWEDVFISPDSLKIVDSLNSDSSIEALSARQGKILNEKINAVKSLDFLIVDSLPDPGQSGVIYMVSKSPSTSDDNKYCEYLWISAENRYEEIGPFVNITVDQSLSESSINPVQNKVITQNLKELDDKTKHPVVKISTSETGASTVVSHTWDEIRKFIQDETPIRALFDGLDIATPLEVHYQNAEDGYYSGVISTAEFRREFRIDHSLSVDITDTYGLQTFIFTHGSTAGSSGESLINTPQDTINACIAAYNNDPKSVRIIANLEGNINVEFFTLTRAGQKLVGSQYLDASQIGIASKLNIVIFLSTVEGQSGIMTTDASVDLSDYYTKEETNTKLSGYAPVYDCSWILDKSVGSTVTDEVYTSVVTALSKGYSFQLQKGLYKIPVLVGLIGETMSNPILYFVFADSVTIRTIEVRKASEGLPVIYSDTAFGYYTIESKQDKPSIITGMSSSVSVTGESSKLYSEVSLTSLTITATKTDSSQHGVEEVFQFSTGASPTITITGVSWANSDVPTFEANKTYEIHIMYNAILDKFLAAYAVYE